MFVVSDHRQAFREWFSEHDVTVAGRSAGSATSSLSVRTRLSSSWSAARGAGRRAAEDDPMVFSSGTALATLMSEVSGSRLQR